MNIGSDHRNEEVVIVCTLEKQQLERLSVKAQDIATATNQDQVLLQVYTFKLGLQYDTGDT